MGNRSAGRRGARVRTLLTAVVLLPLLGLGGFAAQHVQQQLHSAGDATAVESAVADAATLAGARTKVLDEILPAVTQAVFRFPQLRQAVGAGTASLGSLGVSDALVDELRADTDAAMARLVANPGTRAAARQVEPKITAARAGLMTPTGMLNGYLTYVDVVRTLASAETSTVERARTHLVDTATSAHLRDLDLVSAAAQEQSQLLLEVTSVQFGSLGGATEAQAVQLWGNAEAASETVLTKAGQVVAAAWRRAMTSADATQLDHILTSTLIERTKIGFPTQVRLFGLNRTRTAALFTVAAAVDRDAVGSAAALHDTARQAALVAGLVAALILFVSVGVAIAIRQAISRPLLELASSARRISEGDLAQVEVSGPREVRTVANGLSAAVENLRNVSTQAAAVASGDLSSSIVREPLPGALGAVMHESVSAVISAIRQRDAAQGDLAHRAAHDALTELPNRLQAMDAITGALHRASRSGAMTGVMFIDLDNFKMVNDTFGHNAGDTVLRTSARRMLYGVRAGDQVFRLGGDEFVVLLENVGSEIDSVQIAQRMIVALSRPVDINGDTATVGASIGIAFSSDASVDAERLLSDADAAVYRAKQSGRGRVEIFDDELRATLSARADLETAIAAGIKNEEFVLYYQPIVELSSGKTVGTEALIRWQRPGFGLVPPGEFIPTAEGSVLINQLGRWALGEATRQLASWDEAGDAPSELAVSVNISGRHLMSPQLVDEVRAALERSGIAPHRLIIEITESVLVDDPIATDNMTRLRELGVGIAIDDFGTGYTSIGQLPLLPIDKLKIDRSFVASTDPAHRELVRLIVAAAHAFGLTVVAEGIELAHQLDDMAQVGVETGQGYYFARPAPAGQPHDAEQSLAV